MKRRDPRKKNRKRERLVLGIVFSIVILAGFATLSLWILNCQNYEHWHWESLSMHYHKCILSP